ncbi:Class IV sirtuins [Klebsormidium nitens]|uniref:protein acetyllysine N-acetyltransferase n=1 Tax=Klebsormidium nitens TaxID=105231 RepID=A0A0U9HI29_KLENI|nr:Class IV sirtuins [Klebsormidium nitens]|eukprot:GAQ77978.1 Class IV sirtuins [Klebsormidium nitens]
MEQRTAEQLALLVQHKDLAAQITDSMEASRQRKRMKAEREKEVEDPPEVLEAKLRQLADIIKSSDRVVFHTGAGLSTAAGIPDFRGPQGVWTLQKKGQMAGMNMRYEEARPTQAHIIIAEMVRRQLISHVVTQNVDGLLLRAGVPADRLSELHGCVYTERCPSCGRSYQRGYDVTAANGTAFRRHSTGRTCDGLAQLGGATSAEQVSAASEGLRASENERRGGSYVRTGGEKEEEARGKEGDNRRARLREDSEGPAQGVGQRCEDGFASRLETNIDTGSEPPVAETAADCSVESKASEATGAGGSDGHERNFELRERGCKSEPGESTPWACCPGEPGVEENKSDQGKEDGATVQRCGAQLRDTIVHFGERLDENTLRTAREASDGADVAVVLGTSLKVPPASTLPGLAKTVIIINLQWTAKDKKAALKINGRCEDVMGRLAQLLNIAVPEYDIRKDPNLCRGLCSSQIRPAVPPGALGNTQGKVEEGAVAKGAALKKRRVRQTESRGRAAFPRPVL